jgi:Fe-S-cluster containining protein
MGQSVALTLDPPSRIGSDVIGPAAVIIPSMAELVRLTTPRDRCRPEPIPGLQTAVESVDASAIDAIRAIYADLAAAVDARRPVCSASGACCHFDAYGHRLYVTTLELAAFVRDLQVQPTNTDRGGCPFQLDRLCNAHAARPFGCRIYYCDPTAQLWQQEQYELFHARIKALHETTGTPYFYVEWRAALLSASGPATPLGSPTAACTTSPQCDR